jgi:UDP:flavonoid glycosyltransferase YjiC (YdhE family)
MRVLFTTQPGSGHFNPLAPFARALVGAGHEVAFACAESFRPDVEAAGFAAFPAGLDWRIDRMTQFIPDAPPPGPGRMSWINRHWRDTTARATAPDLLALAERWRPDLFVREGSEFGACLAAELLELPNAVAGALWFRPQAPLMAPLDAVRRDLGLAPDPMGAQIYRYLALAPMPPSWVAPDEELPPTVHFVRQDPRDPAVGGDLQSWLADRPLDRPLVHATLGTTEANRTPGLYEAILAGLRDEPVDLVVAVGEHQDPAGFGSQPPHVRVECHVDHGALLPRCDAVGAHGGFGTIMGCLAAGVPMVVIPVQGDQPRNAQRCADLGVGLVVGPEERTPEAIRAAVRAVLAEPSYRKSAERLRDEINALPGMDRAMHLLEQLAVDRKPLLNASSMPPTAEPGAKPNNPAEAG